MNLFPKNDILSFKLLKKVIQNDLKLPHQGENVLLLKMKRALFLEGKSTTYQTKLM